MAQTDHAEAVVVSQPELLRKLRDALNDPSLPLSHRYRALFGLKHHACLNPPTPNTAPAIEAIASAFKDPSALLKHEVAYCLGQTRNTAIISPLRAVLEDLSEEAMVRHEAAEALGALGDTSILDLLVRKRDDESEPTVVRETCEIAVERIKWEKGEARKAEKLKTSAFASVDPAPPLPEDGRPADIEELKRKLLDVQLPLFIRYRAMFALRDLSSPPNLPTAVPAVLALAAGFADKSALFRHEIAFVFGQLGHPASIPSLFETLKMDDACMVRHEAAEALGSLGDEDGVEDMLRQFAEDKEQVVRESVIVALDMAEFERSGELQYATIPGLDVAAA